MEIIDRRKRQYMISATHLSTARLFNASNNCPIDNEAAYFQWEVHVRYLVTSFMKA